MIIRKEEKYRVFGESATQGKKNRLGIRYDGTYVETDATLNNF